MCLWRKLYLNLIDCVDYNHSQNIWHKLLFSAEKVQFLFFRGVFLILTKFPFRGEDWVLAKNTMKFWDTNLSLIITLRFICGERKICSKSQNMMNVIVAIVSLVFEHEPSRFLKFHINFYFCKSTFKEFFERTNLSKCIQLIMKNP